jgi:ribonuclease P/MRP protein subunit RPP1
MSMYDYCILEGSDPAALSEKAAMLGWDGLCLLDPESPEGVEAKGKTGIDIVRGILIETDKAETVRKEARRVRERFGVIAVRGLSEEANRAVAETPAVDILLPGEDSRIDYVMVKLAKKNNVAIGFELRSLLQSSGVDRSRVFSRLKGNAKIVSKFGGPFVITSGAMSEWDIRAPSELIAFGRVLGFETPKITKAISSWLIEGNRKRLGGKWVMPGVEVE